MGIKKAKPNGDFKIIDEVANKFMQKNYRAENFSP